MPRKYDPKILYNPTGQKVEFRCGGISYAFKPGEKKALDGYVAYHALNMVNTGLQELHLDDTEAVSQAPEGEIDYESMPWKKLVSLASEKGIFKPGMSKDDLIKELNG